VGVSDADKESAIDRADGVHANSPVVGPKVFESERVRINKNSDGLIEGDVVLGQIMRGFPFIPFELHR
tara:strand:- start:201 stop:404 length:204 start_codon:yes stop_codon:yes gene_type:complete